MPVDRAVELGPITTTDIGQVAEFLNAHLNSRVPASAWADAMVPGWSVDAPNHGFLLREGDRLVGAYLAFYSERDLDGDTVRVCNLAAWCVLEEYRSHGLRLVRALLAQPGYHFTDLSPSGNVVPLNRRLKFQTLDTTTAMVPNLPWPTRRRGVGVTSDRSVLERTLTGRDLEIYRDHARAAAARHVLVSRGDEHCYLILRRDRRKRLPIFGSILHVGNPALFADAIRPLTRHLLLRHRVLVTLAELRVVGERPRPSVMMSRPRPRMFRSDRLQPAQVDYLYSELTCVAW